MLLREMTNPAFAHSFKRFAQLAVVGLALAGLTACGGGGGKSSTPTPTTQTPTPKSPPEIPIRPAPAEGDHPNTLAEAVVIAAGATVEGSIGSPDDVDFFKLQLTDPGTVTFWTTGEADTAIALLDGEGNELAATGASSMPGASSGTPLSAAFAGAGATITASNGRVSVTTGLDEVFARVSGREGSTGDYTLHNEAANDLAPRILRALAPVTLKAGASTTVDLSGAFEDPEGGALTFSHSFGTGQVGPVSLGVTISGSVMSITSPAAMQPGPVSISVTASDPLGLFTVQVLTVTVTAGTQPAEQPADLNGCVDPMFRRTGDGVGEGCPYSFHASMTNGCSIEITVRFGWEAPELESGWEVGALVIDPGEEGTATAFCEASQPRFRFCVQPESFSTDQSHRCFRGNIPWQYR